MIKRILALLTLLSVAGIAFASSLPVGGSTYYLSGAGVNATQNTIQLSSFTTPDGTPITMTMFGTIGYGALEPQTTAKIEDVTFTGITQNTNGTATLTGVTRGLQFVYPYTQSVTLEKSHSGGATFIITNTAGFYYNEFTMNNNNNLFTWPAASTSPATRGYVDFVAFNGAAVINANTVNKGVVQIATGAQAAASTGAGSTGATVVLPASVASSTWNKATAANVIPVSASNGYIDNNFLSPYASTTWAASSTAKATFHGLPYSFPSIRGASSTALAEDGAGNLTWQNYDLLLNGASSTPQLIIPSTASSTLYSFPLPGGLLGTKNVLRITLYMDSGGDLSNDLMYFEMGYGNSTTTASIRTPQTTDFNQLKVTFTISGNSATNSQVLFGDTNATTSVKSLPVTASTDSTVVNNITIVLRSPVLGPNSRTYYATTELLRY